ncbi:hypothetical protein B0H13DRAFT_2379561 [Mycena leptocephala]|nr:hypothetical protein B0H13DRAFT_2379561 [Mycena leptocephala]
MATQSASLEGWCTAREVLMQTLSDDAPGPAAHCGGCKTNLWSEVDGGTRFFSCDACATLACYACCVSDHRQMPLHFLKEWTGVAWQTATLAEIGLVYQLGHRGLECQSPTQVVHSRRIIDMGGIQTVNFQFCGCHSRTSEDGQLAEAGWELSSIAMNRAATATRSVLEMFSKLALA